MALRIVADSSIDIHDLPGVDFRSVPLKMMCGTHEFVDNRDLDVRGMCEFFEKSRDKSGTSCPNIMDWREAFEDADEILAVTISSGMSASYSACVQAMEEYLEEHPGVKGFAMDSLATGPGMRILVDRALELIHQGLTFDEMVQELKTYRKHTFLMFSLQSMNNMARNGRLPLAVVKAASILGIRIIAMADEEGKVRSLSKCRGRKKLPGMLVDEVLRLGYKGGRMYIDHCFADELVDEFTNMIRDLYPEAEFSVVATGGLCTYYAERGGVIIGFEDGMARP